MHTECSQDRVFSINNIVSLLRDVSRPVELGLQLGIDYGTLQRIEKENRSDIGRQIIEVINFWLENFAECSWGTLARAIRNLGGHDLLADRILKQMGKEQSTQLKPSGELILEHFISMYFLEKGNFEVRYAVSLCYYHSLR